MDVKNLKSGDILMIKRSSASPCKNENYDDTVRKFEVVQLYPNYILCKRLQEKCYNECFFYCDLVNRVVSIERKRT